MWCFVANIKITLGEVIRLKLAVRLGDRLLQTREDKNITSNFSKTLHLTYDWFEKGLGSALSETLSDFWEQKIDAKLLSISENSNFLVAGEEFFVTQIRLNKELSVFIRLSKDLVKNLLENILGPNGKTFNLEKISDLEARILTGFDNNLYKNFSSLLKPAEKLPQNNTNYNECNLTFYLQCNEKSYGKIVIKIPVVALCPEQVACKSETFTINNFLKNTANVTLCAGHSRVKLNDIKTLEKGDIVLLENSKSDQMILKYDGYETVFKIQPNPLLYVDYDIENDGENSGGNKNMSNNLYNMWDSIQVEIGAEFEKVKLTLGELKQISEGLVVDIGSIYDNKIDLKVEDKIVASGELVIINDRYGVKVNQIFTEEETTEEIVAPTEENYQTKQFEETEQYEEDNNSDEYNEQDEEQSQSNPEADEDDFDYSNFDLDDEDL